jgi:hypothetical protein
MKKKDLIYEIIIPDYPSKIKLSDSRRAIYYHKSKHRMKLPKKYQSGRYTWGNDGYLYDIEDSDNKKIIKNSKSAGTPRYWAVNFQAIWNQQIKHQARASVTNKLKDIFRPYLKDLDIITEYPIKMELFLHDVEMPIDVDNKGVVYTKVITDLLVNTNKGEDDNRSIIPDDSSTYVNDTGRCKWVKVNNYKDIKMVIRIWKSNNLPT